MAKPFCFYSQLRTCSFHSLKYIEIHWNNKGEFSALMTQVVNLKLIKLNLMLLIRNRCLPSNSNVFGFSRKEAWKGLGNTKKGASNVHHSSYMASTPIRSTTTTHRWGCLHPLEKMQEEECAHGVWNDNHFIPMVCLYHGLNCALYPAQRCIPYLIIITLHNMSQTNLVFVRVY